MHLKYWNNYMLGTRALWLPGHEAGDQMATAALTNARDKTTVLYTGLRTYIRKLLRRTWKWHSSRQTDNKLHIMNPNHGQYTIDLHNGHTEVASAGLRIGHTHVNNSHLPTGSNRLMCSRCGKGLSVVHILITCKALDQTTEIFPRTLQSSTHHTFKLTNQCSLYILLLRFQEW